LIFAGVGWFVVGVCSVCPDWSSDLVWVGKFLFWFVVVFATRPSRKFRFADRFKIYFVGAVAGC
jgi:hypothetical protein